MSELARLTRALGQALLDLNAAAAVEEEAKRSLRDHLGHFTGTREQHEAWLEAKDARDAVRMRVRAAHGELDAFAEKFAAQPPVLERVVEYVPGFDVRPVPEQPNIGGGHLKFTVVGPLGATSFELLTHWYPATVEPDIRAALSKFLAPENTRMLYHLPIAADHERATPCLHSSTGFCIEDDHYEYSDTHRGLLLDKGSEEMWQQLEQDYREMFEFEGFNAVQADFQPGEGA